MGRSAHRKILDSAAIERVIARLAQEIVERSPDAENPVLIGVRTRGVPLAQRIAQRIKASEQVEVPVGILDITLYRDDFTTVGSHPILRNTEIPFAITDRRVILVDDVLFTGRTARAALDGLIDFGRPRRIELAVLVDRGHRELPIHADYVGKTVATTAAEFVRVSLREIEGEEDAVFVGELAKVRKKLASK